MKKIYSYLSLILAILMLTSALASCTGGGRENESSEIESESVSEESEEGEDTSDEGGINDAPKLEGEDAKAIENAYLLANGVHAYYTDGKRSGFVTENQNMKLTYSTDMLSERKVTSLTDKNGNAYLYDTMDIFVKMQNGGTYYASKSANSTKVSQFAGLNIFRFGYYYYDVRIEDQNFVNEIKVLAEKSLDIRKIASKEGVDTKYGSNGLTCYLTGNSVDPQVVFSNISFDTADYNYLAITMKSDLPATDEADCQFFRLFS